MTREDIDNIINIVCPNDEDFEKSIISPAYLKKELEALALEQEPILEKIRAEIVKKHLSIVEKNGFDSGRTYGYEEVLDIIDKYKAESEG